MSSLNTDMMQSSATTHKENDERAPAANTATGESHNLRQMGVFFPNKSYNSAAEASMALLRNRQLV